MDGTLPTPAPRLRRRLLALVGAALAALMAATATAAPADEPAAPQLRWPAGGPALAVAADLAAAHWAATPCHGRVALSWATLAPGINARSDWAHAGTDPYGAPARNSACAIVLSTAADWDWEKLCTVVIHEVGHLDGHDHSADPDDVMAATYAEPAPECAATPEPDPAGGDVLSSYFTPPPPPAAAATSAAKAKARPRPKAKPRHPRAKARRAAKR